MTRRLSLAVVLVVLSGLLFAAGAPGEVAAPSRIAAVPETTIDSGPADGSTTSSSTATFTFSSSEMGSTFECSRDGAPFTTCSSPKSYPSVSLGPHTFFVRATDPSDNTGPADSRSWTVVSADSAPPETTITSVPIGTTSSTSATFTFTSTEGGSTFECRRDAQVFGPCPASKTYNGLSLGSHTFFVRATDGADNTDASPASETWTVVPADPFPPETTITSGPFGTTSSTSATFEFTSSDIGSTFECRRNLAAFIPCASPITYSGLGDGSHTFEVRATDPSDNVDATPAILTWIVASNVGGVPPVANLRAVAGDHRIRLRWTNPTGFGIQRIEIRRGTRLVRAFFNPANRFVDTNVFNGRRYNYSIVVFDDVVHRSPAALVFAVPHGKLKAPGDGKTIRRPPVLRWLPRARATYYNVQLFRNGRKIQSQWPARPRLQLKNQWRYQGRNYTLRDGRYVWWVFAGFGKRADNRYAKKAWGYSTFIKR